MNALPLSDAESARRREDMLRELNLFPLWQLRNPAAASAEAEVLSEEPDPLAVKTGQASEAAPPPAVDARPEIAGMGWSELKKTVKTCNACDLRAGCLQTVFGVGDEKADWLFVGSWPTEDDESSGTAFAGQAGQLLDNMLAAIKLKRGNNVYLSNVVKCSGSIRRGPQPTQIARCAGYLIRQIQLLQPKLIVVLGHSTATALLAEDREWSSLLGRVHEYRGHTNDPAQAAIPLIITHHPAALLLSPLNKAQTWKDLCLARDTMRQLAERN